MRARRPITVRLVVFSELVKRLVMFSDGDERLVVFSELDESSLHIESDSIDFWTREGAQRKS